MTKKKTRKVKPYPHVPEPPVDVGEQEWVSLDKKLGYATAFLIAVVVCTLLGAMVYFAMELL